MSRNRTNYSGIWPVHTAILLVPLASSFPDTNSRWCISRRSVDVKSYGESRCASDVSSSWVFSRSLSRVGLIHGTSTAVSPFGREISGYSHLEPLLEQLRLEVEYKQVIDWSRRIVYQIGRNSSQRSWRFLHGMQPLLDLVCRRRALSDISICVQTLLGNVVLHGGENVDWSFAIVVLRSDEVSGTWARVLCKHTSTESAKPIKAIHSCRIPFR